MEVLRGKETQQTGDREKESKAAPAAKVRKQVPDEVVYVLNSIETAIMAGSLVLPATGGYTVKPPMVWCREALRGLMQMPTSSWLSMYSRSM